MSKNNGLPAGGSKARRPRRELLAGAAGALGVVAAGTLARATPAQADTGQPVLQGVDNGFPASRTAVITLSGNEQAILADPGAKSTGVQGVGQDFGVFGNGGSANGIGVGGQGGGSGIGVAGTGGPNSGVGGRFDGGGSNGIGVQGFGHGSSTGVQGFGGSGDGTGVVGAGGGSNGVGVNGFGLIGVRGAGGPAGVGVQGVGQGSGDGVAGTAAGGKAVHGTATDVGGVGVLAENTAAGTALQVSGTAVFSRSGILTIGAGASTVTMTGVALTAASLVLATLQQDRAGVYIRSAVPDVAASSFTVHLNKAVSASLAVAWFVVN